MPNFYRLVAVIDDDTLSIDQISHEDHSFTIGDRFPADFPEPVLFAVDGDFGGSLVPTMFLPLPVIRADFLEDLRAAGVANVDDYSAQIRGLEDHKTIVGYRAINIIGAVACADLGRSKYEEFEGMTFFDHLVIDPERVGGATFFRLAEAHEYIVVAKKVVDFIEPGRYPDVQFLPIDS